MCRRLRDGNPCLKDQIGRPKTCWEDDVFEDIKSINISNWKKVAQNRDSWKKVVEQASTLHRLWRFTCVSYDAQRTLHKNSFEIVLNHIQGVSRLSGIPAGGDFLGLCDQKSSYKHVSDFGRLRSYDRLNLGIEGNDY